MYLSAAPSTEDATKEMIKPCLIYVHAVSLVVSLVASLAWPCCTLLSRWMAFQSSTGVAQTKTGPQMKPCRCSSEGGNAGVSFERQ